MSSSDFWEHVSFCSSGCHAAAAAAAAGLWKESGNNIFVENRKIYQPACPRTAQIREELQAIIQITVAIKRMLKEVDQL